MTTKGRPELQELIAKWRKPVVGFNDPSYYGGMDAGREACADELEAALRSLEEGRQAQTEASAVPQEEK